MNDLKINMVGIDWVQRSVTASKYAAYLANKDAWLAMCDAFTAMSNVLDAMHKAEQAQTSAIIAAQEAISAQCAAWIAEVDAMNAEREAYRAETREMENENEISKAEFDRTNSEKIIKSFAVAADTSRNESSNINKSMLENMQQVNIANSNIQSIKSDKAQTNQAEQEDSSNKTNTTSIKSGLLGTVAIKTFAAAKEQYTSSLQNDQSQVNYHQTEITKSETVVKENQSSNQSTDELIEEKKSEKKSAAEEKHKHTETKEIKASEKIDTTEIKESARKRSFDAEKISEDALYEIASAMVLKSDADLRTHNADNVKFDANVQVKGSEIMIEDLKDNKKNINELSDFLTNLATIIKHAEEKNKNENIPNFSSSNSNALEDLNKINKLKSQLISINKSNLSGENTNKESNIEEQLIDTKENIKEVLKEALELNPVPIILDKKFKGFESLLENELGINNIKIDTRNFNRRSDQDRRELSSNNNEDINNGRSDTASRRKGDRRTYEYSKALFIKDEEVLKFLS
ncbi:MAG: hypothetical protein AB1782_13555 [Cyanobacteriota bacterium]